MVIHRAGSDLKANLHFHSMFLDGCYSASGRFWTAPAPTPAEVEKILTRIVARAERLFGDDVQHDPDEEEQAIEKAYTLSTRAERHGPEDQDPHDFGVQLSTRRKARLGQWDLDAEVALEAHDRERLEHLCRYLIRPPLAPDRLRLLADDKVCVELERPWSDFTTHVTMTPDALIARLATLVPRPRRNTTIYFGVLAARGDIVPCPENERRRAPRTSTTSLANTSGVSFALFNNGRRTSGVGFALFNNGNPTARFRFRCGRTLSRASGPCPVPAQRRGDVSEPALILPDRTLLPSEERFLPPRAASCSPRKPSLPNCALQCSLAKAPLPPRAASCPSSTPTPPVHTALFSSRRMGTRDGGLHPHADGARSRPARAAATRVS